RRLESEIEDSDRRWVLCHRPCVETGGELTAEMLELQFNPVSRYYSAPLQMKANNGIFVIDDFGRQRMRPQELLNRWMTALDQLTNEIKVPLSQCYARDLLDQVFWAARYLNAKPEFNKDLAKWACSNYFFSGIGSSTAQPTE